MSYLILEDPDTGPAYAEPEEIPAPEWAEDRETANRLMGYFGGLMLFGVGALALLALRHWVPIWIGTVIR